MDAVQEQLEVYVVIHSTQQHVPELRHASLSTASACRITSKEIQGIECASVWQTLQTCMYNVSLHCAAAEQTAVMDGWTTVLIRLVFNGRLYRELDRWRNVTLQFALSGCVMSCQNVWVTVNCPATRTIEGKVVGLSKVQSNIRPRLQLVCLYWSCSDRFQEMTSRIRPDSQEIDSPVLLVSLLLAPQTGFCVTPAFDVSLFFTLEFYCWCWTFWVDSDKISCWSLTGNVICCLSLFLLHCYFWRTNHGTVSPFTLSA